MPTVHPSSADFQAIITRLDALANDDWKRQMEVTIARIDVRMGNVEKLLNGPLAKAQKACDEVGELKLDLAKRGYLTLGAGAAGGGIVGIAGGALLFVGKALGWW